MTGSESSALSLELKGHFSWRADLKGNAQIIELKERGPRLCGVVKLFQKFLIEKYLNDTQLEKWMEDLIAAAEYVYKTASVEVSPGSLEKALTYLSSIQLPNSTLVDMEIYAQPDENDATSPQPSKKRKAGELAGQDCGDEESRTADDGVAGLGDKGPEKKASSIPKKETGPQLTAVKLSENQDYRQS